MPTNKTINSHPEQSRVFPELLTKDELAARLKLTRRGVECLMARRLIPFIRVGRSVRFEAASTMAALQRLEVREIGRH